MYLVFNLLFNIKLFNIFNKTQNKMLFLQTEYDSGILQLY